MKKINLSWIDSLKGIAICGVIMIHSGAAGLPGILGRIGAIGQNGVQLFFVISALLAYVSLDHLFHDRKSEITMKKIVSWWKRKFIRLAPLWYLSVIVFCFYGGNHYWLGSEEHITIKNILAHILFIHGFFPHYIDSILGVEWYLGDLAIFFILVPLVYKYIDSLEKSIALFVGTTFCCSILNYFACSFFPQTEDVYLYEIYVSNFWIFAQLPVLFLGIVLYFILKGDIFEKINDKILLSYTILLFSLGMLGGMAWYEAYCIGLSVSTVFGIWFTFMAVSQVIWKCPLIVNRFFSALGKHSYPMYLFHYLFIRIYDKYAVFSTGNSVIDWGIKYITIVALSISGGWLLTKFIENPINKWFSVRVC